jgi:putative aminopeptidase FrvX
MPRCERRKSSAERVRAAPLPVKAYAPRAVALPDLLRDLLTTPGPSGHETEPAAVWRRAAEAFAEVSSDALGSSTARVKGTADGPSLALVGHIDEIGLAITHIDDKGFLWFRGIGGWLPEVLHAQRVEVLTRDGRIPGVIGKKRGPWKRDKDEKLELKDLCVDIGARDGDEARAAVRIGDAAVLVGPPVEARNGTVISRSWDNRVGCYVALEVARRVAGAGGSPGDVIAVAAIGEEVGDFAGSRTTAYSVRPDVAIAIDVTDAKDIPEAELTESGDVRLGGGPVIDRGTPVSVRVSELLCETAEQEGIPFGIQVSRGHTHTDADAYHLSRAGIPTGLVSIATRYIHTPTELVSLDDVENAVRLLVAVAQRLGSVDLRPA